MKALIFFPICLSFLIVLTGKQADGAVSSWGMHNPATIWQELSWMEFGIGAYNSNLDEAGLVTDDTGLISLGPGSTGNTFVVTASVSDDASSGFASAEMEWSLAWFGVVKSHSELLAPVAVRPVISDGVVTFELGEEDVYSGNSRHLRQPMGKLNAEYVVSIDTVAIGSMESYFNPIGDESTQNSFSATLGSGP